MLLTPAILVSSLLGLVVAAPVPSTDESKPYSGPMVSRIVDTPPAPGTVVVIPPPLFDPAEPRPNPLFGSPSPVAPDSGLKTAPIQKSRTETLLPFDGAHVHPYVNPYRPESLPGTCAYIFDCQVARTSAEITGTILIFSMIVYALIYISNKLIRRIIWSAKGRTRSPSGSLRMEPELGDKISASQQETAAAMTRAPLVKVWSENGTEKVVF